MVDDPANNGSSKRGDLADGAKGDSIALVITGEELVVPELAGLLAVVREMVDDPTYDGSREGGNLADGSKGNSITLVFPIIAGQDFDQLALLLLVTVRTGQQTGLGSNRTKTYPPLNKLWTALITLLPMLAMSFTALRLKAPLSSPSSRVNSSITSRCLFWLLLGQSDPM